MLLLKIKYKLTAVSRVRLYEINLPLFVPSDVRKSLLEKSQAHSAADLIPVNNFFLRASSFMFAASV